MSYVKSLIKKECFADLHPLIVCKSISKEITESYGAYHNMLMAGALNDNINLHIGDGSRCTTAAIFSFITDTVNFSIDPIINIDRLKKWISEVHPKRFIYYKQRWQDFFRLHEYMKKVRCNIVLVHSHVNVVEINSIYKNWEFMYVNPCCDKPKQIFPLSYMHKNNISCIFAGIDDKILSPKNEIYIYKNNNVNR